MMQRIQADKMQGSCIIFYCLPYYLLLCLSENGVPLSLNELRILFRLHSPNVMTLFCLIVSKLPYWISVLLTGMHHDKIFRLPGAYRHLVTLAKNVRVAPVHTSKKKQRRSDEDSDGDRIDAADTDSDNDDLPPDEIIERLSEPEDKRVGSESSDRENGVSETLSSMDPPVWMTPSDYLSSTSSTTTASSPNSSSESAEQKSQKEGRKGGSEGEYPFSSQVEKMWVSDIIPNLLHDIYSTSSSALHSSNIGLLPSALTKAVDADQHSAHSDSHGSQSDLSLEAAYTSGSSSSYSDSGDRDVGAIEGLRISFSLCASTYATTFLDHLVDAVNKEVQRK